MTHPERRPPRTRGRDGRHAAPRRAVSRYWLGLGANLGDRRAALEAALAWLDREGHRSRP